MPIRIAVLLEPQSAPQQLHNLLHNQGRWEVSPLAISDYRDILNRQRFDVIVLTHCPTDTPLLYDLLTLQPQAVRLLIYKDAPPKNIEGLELLHQSIDAACPPQQLQQQLVSLLRLNHRVFNPKVGEYIDNVDRLPSPPKIFHELNRALASPSSNSEAISKLISRDPALTAQILKIANSAYFRVNRRIANISEAITLLGLSMIRSMALSGHLVNQYPQHPHWSYFSFEQLNSRALQVAQLTQHICQDMQMPRHLRDQAFISAILQDLGILLFASQDPKSYRKVMVRSAQDNIPLCAVEKKMLGIFHGEVAAFLLAQWQLPTAIAEAVLFRHTPQLSDNREFSPLTALHIADALIEPLTTEISANMKTRLRQDYLQQVGVWEKLPQWQAAAAPFSKQPLDTAS